MQLKTYTKPIELPKKVNINKIRKYLTNKEIVRIQFYLKIRERDHLSNHSKQQIFFAYKTKTPAEDKFKKETKTYKICKKVINKTI